MLGVFEALDDAGGGADGAPADAVIGGDDEAGVDGFCAGKNFGEDVGLRFGVVGVEHGGADVGDELLLGGEVFVIAEEFDGLFGGEAFGVFGEGLRGDADALDGVAAGFEEGAGVLERFHRVGDLLLVFGAVEIDEGGDGADFGFGGVGGGGGGGGALGVGGGREDD